MFPSQANVLIRTGGKLIARPAWILETLPCGPTASSCTRQEPHLDRRGGVLFRAVADVARFRGRRHARLIPSTGGMAGSPAFAGGVSRRGDLSTAVAAASVPRGSAPAHPPCTSDASPNYTFTTTSPRARPCA